MVVSLNFFSGMIDKGLATVRSHLLTEEFHFIV